MMNKIFLLLITLIPLIGVSEASNDRPHWAFELKGGDFEPSLDRWGEFYGKDKMRQFSVSLAYRWVRQIDVGIESGYRRDKGQGRLEGSKNLGGEVVYENYPVTLFAVLRGVFTEGQWLVPYVGGGLNRIYYKTAIENQKTARGAMNGYTIRGGVQLLLDALDKTAAHHARSEYGLKNTYIVLEVQESKTEKDLDIGGRVYSLGLLFEF